MAAGKSVISAVNSAMKYLYPDGTPPEVINEEYKLWKRIKKKTDFVGEQAYVVLKHQNPQGVGSSVSGAQTAVGSSQFKRFTLTRNKAHAVAQIDGELAESAIRTQGALVDMLANEINGVAQSLTHDLAVWMYGSGDGCLGATTGTSTGTTLTFATGTNMAWFELGMTVGLVDVAGFATAPTTRKNGGSVATYQLITSIDRSAGTITCDGSWSDGVSGDYVVRMGFAVTTSGTNSTYIGLPEYVKGGSSPGTIYSLSRNTDPARLAGLTAAYTGQAMEDAVLDASAKLAVQGCGKPSLLVANPLRVSQMKRSLGGKIIYDRQASKDVGVGFDKVMFETESGPVEVLADPYCPLSTAYLLKEDAFTMWSLKAAPHLVDKDGNDMLRVYNDDSWEARWRFYGALKLDNPAPQFRLTGFGA